MRVTWSLNVTSSERGFEEVYGVTKTPDGPSVVGTAEVAGVFGFDISVTASCAAVADGYEDTADLPATLRSFASACLVHSIECIITGGADYPSEVVYLTS